MSFQPETAQIWSSILTCGATLLLAGLTFIYVRLLKKQGTQQYQPRLVLTGTEGGDSCIITNAGNSPAVNVSFTRVGAGSMGQTARTIGLLSPGEQILLTIAGLKGRTPGSPATNITLTVECETLLGKRMKRDYSADDVRSGETAGTQREDSGEPAFRVTT